MDDTHEGDGQGRVCHHRQVLGFLEARAKCLKLKREEAPGSKGMRIRRCGACGGWYLSTSPRLRWLRNNGRLSDPLARLLSKIPTRR